MAIVGAGRFKLKSFVSSGKLFTPQLTTHDCVSIFGAKKMCCITALAFRD